MRLSIPSGPAFGLALSLLAHAAVIAWLARLAPPARAPEAPASPMQVRLLRLPPRVAPPVETTAIPAPTRQRTTRATAPPGPAAPKTPAVAAAAAPVAASEALPLITAAPRDEAAATVGSPAPDAGRFDVQAARATARSWVMGEGAGLGGADGKGAPMRATRDEKLGEAIERSRPADCRSAYAGMGVLAVIPLAASAVTGKGCKW